MKQYGQSLKRHTLPNYQSEAAEQANPNKELSRDASVAGNSPLVRAWSGSTTTGLYNVPIRARPL